MEFKKKLGVAYYNQGFFNIGVEYSDYFGEHGSIVNVELGDKKNVIVGKINRTANNNGTPRIMMGTQYKEWVQQAFKQWEFMNVKVINPKLLHLYKNSKKMRRH